MHSDREIQLTETERNIIYHLMTAKDQGLSREDMLQSVWAYHQDIETHTLETHIYRLRQKIEPDSTKPQHIIYDSNLYKLT
jgi:DNA-binding response OmpR family regulator